MKEISKPRETAAHRDEGDSHRRVSSFGPLVWIVLLGVQVLACQPPDRTMEFEFRYTPPAAHEVEGAVLLDGSVDDVWGRLEGGMASPEFARLAADREAGFIVAEFLPAGAGGAAGDFVDCGSTDVTVTADGIPEHFRSRVIDSGRDREVESTPDHFVVRELDRAVGLNLRTTIYVKSVGPERTRLTLNTRYEVVLEISGHRQIVPRDGSMELPAAEVLPPERRSASFASFTEGAFAESSPIRCRPTGAVEARTLALATPEKTSS